MIHSRQVTSETGKIKDIDDAGVSLYRLQLQCDDCGRLWETTVWYWQQRKSRNMHNGLDLCKFCAKKGNRNPAYGQNPHKHMSQEEIQILKESLSQTLSGKNNPMYGKRHSPETRALQSKSKVDLIDECKFNIKSCNRGRKAFYLSTKSNIQFYADSILELARMVELDKDSKVQFWTKHHGIRIPYVFEGAEYNYVPDFFIGDESGTKIIEEVKGRMTPRDVEKQKQAIIYCKQNGFEYRLVTGNDLQDLENYKRLLKETKQ